MKRFFSLFIIFITAITAFGQVPDSITGYLNSPYSTVVTHLKYLQPNTYHPEIAALSMPAESPETSKKLARQLKQILDGKGLYVDVDLISKNANYIDSTTKVNRFYPFIGLPQIYLEKENGLWYYSKRTIAEIPALHRSVYPFGSDFLMNLFPNYGHKVIAGLQIWQLVGLLLLILLLFIAHKLLTVLLNFIIKRLANRFAHFEANITVVLALSKPLSLFLISLLLVVLLPILQLPIKLNKYLIISLNIISPVFAIVAALKLADLVSNYFEKLAARTSSTLDDQLIPLVRKAMKVFVVVVGVLFILQNLQFNITALLAGVSIGGLAFALAAQDTIKHLFGSAMIFIDRPFQIGDWINSGDVDGTVEEVGFRSTRVRTFYNSLITVPNGKIADMTVDNYGLRVYRRYNSVIAITYDTPPLLIEKFVEGLREIVKVHPFTRKDYFEIHLNDLGSNSINILFYIFFQVPSWSDELKARHEIIMAIIKLAGVLGVQFAFPTQTIHVENMPGQPSLSPKYDADMDRIDAKITEFIETYKLQQADKIS